MLRDSTVFTDDCQTFKSHTWVGASEKRRDNLLAYADREKIEELKKMAKSSVPFEEVSTIRSGYGSIRKIECM